MLTSLSPVILCALPQVMFAAGGGPACAARVMATKQAARKKTEAMDWVSCWVFMGDIKFSVVSKGGERRSVQAVGIWRKYFLCSNQAGTSPHERWIKFSENYFSRRDLF